MMQRLVQRLAALLLLLLLVSPAPAVLFQIGSCCAGGFDPASVYVQGHVIDPYETQEVPFSAAFQGPFPPSAYTISGKYTSTMAFASEGAESVALLTSVYAVGNPEAPGGSPNTFGSADAGVSPYVLLVPEAGEVVGQELTVYVSSFTERILASGADAQFIETYNVQRPDGTWVSAGPPGISFSARIGQLFQAALYSSVFNEGDGAAIANSIVQIGLAPVDDSVLETLLLQAPDPATTMLGDYNRDGRVNTADYVVWRTLYNSVGSYDAWRSRFGHSASGSGARAAIPEPASVLLFAACGAALFTFAPAAKLGFFAKRKMGGGAFHIIRPALGWRRCSGRARGARPICW
jgi:hypothetical protein